MTMAPETLTRGRELVLPALGDAVARLDDTTRRVVSYHLGWCDVDGRPERGDGGKLLRPTLATVSAETVGAHPATGVPGAVAVELVHNFSLLHDDLMDQDTQRRHRETVWSLWGGPTAILAGDALLSLAHEVLLDSGGPQAREAGALLARATRELVRGQVQDLAFESRAEVSLAECVDMAAGKTGALLSASSAIGAVLAGGEASLVDALSTFGNQLGVAFQLVDDLLGIWGDPASTGKPVFSDLASRKKSLPVTFALEQGGAAGDELHAWMSGRTAGAGRHGADTPEDLAHAANLVERAGGRAWAREETARRTDLARQAIDTVTVPDRPRAELLRLAHHLVSRQA